ncbi:MAG: hypothetical protein ACI4TK_05755 [Agathobacter sp.]
MTRAQLEKKYGVQIDDVRSAYKSRHICFSAYKGDQEIARGQKLADLEAALREKANESED